MLRRPIPSSWYAAFLMLALVPAARGTAAPSPQEKEAGAATLENRVHQVAPAAFAITEPLRDMQTDAEATAAKWQSRDAIRKQLMRDRGLSEEEIQSEEINRQNARRIKKVLPGAGAGEGPFQDPLVNNSGFIAPQAMPTPGLTFNGATAADNAAVGIGGLAPPDPNGDVGPNHYVSSVNLVLKIFNKDGSVAAGPIATSSLFGALPAGTPCRTRNDGDPIVVYDSLADRWHISQFRYRARLV